MSPRKPQIAGQEMLEGMPEIPNPYRAELEVQQPFGALVVGERWGLKPEDYSGITPAMVEAISDEKIAPYLFKRPQGRYVIDEIAMTPEEYGAIVRNPKKQDEAVAAKAESGKWKTASQIARQRHVQERREEANLSSSERMLRLLDSYESRISLMKRIDSYALTPGLRRRKSINIKPEIQTILSEIFPEMLSVIGIQKKWNKNQAELAQRAFEKRLFFTGKDRIHNWRTMLDLAISYNKAKRFIALERLKYNAVILIEINREQERLG